MEEDPFNATAGQKGEEVDQSGENTKEIFRWWNVVEQAEAVGQIAEYSSKGKARQNSSRTLSFDWIFQPSSATPASKSPLFHWLDLNWSLRFQKSPFEPGIMHPPAWSIFLDLYPPYKRIHRVSGSVSLVQRESSVVLWKLEETFQPASLEQDVCTWCARRRDLDGYLNQMKGKDITIRIKLSTWGLGTEFALQPMRNEMELLPYTLKVGTTTVGRRFGWDIREHLKTLSTDKIEFWKKLRSDPKGKRKLKFSPRDVVTAMNSDHVMGLATWRACSELKEFFLNAIHKATNGVAFLPYHLVFFDFDLMDGSDPDEDPPKEAWTVGYVCGDKHEIIVTILNWMVLNPLIAAFEKASGKQNASSFRPIHMKELQAEKEKTDNETISCAACSTQKPRKEFHTCSQCHTPPYCNASCQRSHWKVHKKDCKRMKEERKERRKQRKATAEKEEEKKAVDLVDELMDVRLAESNYAEMLMGGRTGPALNKM